MFKIIKAVTGTLITVTALVATQHALAQAWPNRPIEIIVPYAPGGIADTVARLIQPTMKDKLGTPVIINNKPGASGSLATEFVARANPDGYTLLLGLAAPQTLNQYLYKVRYDGLKDFAPVTLINTNPMVLVANPSVPVKSVKELIAYAKAHPGELNFSGAGGLTQYSGEIFKNLVGIDMVHVPYKGGAPAVTAAMAGEVQLTFANYSDAIPWLKTGKLRALGLTSAKRYPQTPDVPTILEQGVPGFAIEGWSGLLAPAGTPPEVVKKIADAVILALKDPLVQKKMYDIGAVPGGNTPDEFTKFISAEIKKWGDFVQRTGIKAE